MQSATDSFKNSSRRVIPKTAETVSDLIVNKITNRTTKVSKKLQQNNSETSANENDKKIAKEKYISPEKRRDILDDLRLNNSKIMKYQKFRKVSKSSPQNNSETVTNVNNKGIPEESCISPEKRQKIIDNLDINIIL